MIRRIPARRGRPLAGLVVGAAIGGAILLLSRLPLFAGYEAKTVDLRQRIFARPTAAADRFAIVLVDDASVAALAADGVPWPWPRDVYEPILAFARESGAAAVVFDLLFLDRQGAGEIDRGFATVAAEGPTYFAAKLVPGEPDADPPAKALVPIAPARGGRPEASRILAPLPELVEASAGLGMVNVVPDADHVLRRFEPVFFLPPEAPVATASSLALRAARHAVGPDARLDLADGELRIGDRRIPLDADGRVHARWYGPERTFPTASAVDVLMAQVADVAEEKPPRVPRAFFAGRVIFVGLDVAGAEDVVAAPTAARIRGVEFQATAAANLAGGEALREPGPAAGALLVLGFAAIAGAAAFLAWRPLAAGATTLGLVAAWTGGAAAAFAGGLVLPLLAPAVAAAGVFTAQTVAAYFAEGRRRKEVQRAFSQYLAPAVVAELVRDPARLALGGETRRIAVLFSDVEGFSAFSERMSPADLVAFLNEYLGAMTDAILDRRGLLDKYIGDAIVALWGAPAPVDNPSREACLAVLDQRRIALALNERFRAAGRPPIRFRTGLSVGDAVVGNMGSSRRFAYTAMGDVVNVASRLEGANRYFGTAALMTGAVRAEAGDAVLARRLGLVKVVGRAEPVEVHELVGAAGDTAPEVAERLATHERALAALEAGRAAEAASLFGGMARQGDPVARRFHATAEELARTGARWDRVWVLTTKGEEA